MSDNRFDAICRTLIDAKANEVEVDMNRFMSVGCVLIGYDDASEKFTVDYISPIQNSDEGKSEG